MRRPLVAVTTFFHERAGRHGRAQAGVYGAYIHALDEVELTPVLISPLHASASVRELLDRCHGLVLTGGGDVSPSRFGEAPIPELGYVSERQDSLEWTLLDAALAREVPVLGICRGIQVINVYMGGTLYQDIDAQKPDAIEHQQAAPWGEPSHEVALAHGTKLRAIMGRERMAVNSHHHQAVRELAPGLIASACSADGLVEALESATLPWLIGIEWHPERYPDDAPADHPDRRLFTAFRDAVVARANPGR